MSNSILRKKSGRPDDVDEGEDVGARQVLSYRGVATAQSREGRVIGRLERMLVTRGKSMAAGCLNGLTSSLQIADLWNEANSVPDDRA